MKDVVSPRAVSTGKEQRTEVEETGEEKHVTVEGRWGWHKSFLLQRAIKVVDEEKKTLNG